MKDKIKDDGLIFYKNKNGSGSYIKNTRTAHRRFVNYTPKYSFGYSDHYYMYGTFEGEQINYWES